MLSAHVRLTENDHEPDAPITRHASSRRPAALGKEGLDLAIIYLPPPHDPAVLEPLANAIRALGAARQQISVTITKI